MMKAKIAIVQQGPKYYDANQSLHLAKSHLEEAKANGADLVVFGEGWFTGYPVWLDYYPNVARWNDPEIKKVYRQMYDHSLKIPGTYADEICRVAKELELVVVMGCNESFGDTLYNAIIVITADGKIANHHRKLMPTYSEKMVHGLGDGAGLKSVSTKFGRLTAGICWEHWMPLTRQALHQSGEDIHVALWPKVHEMHQVASRHYAFEGRCWVVAVGQMVHKTQMPAPFQEQILPDYDWLLDGGSCVIDPSGNYLLPPQFNRDEIIYQQIDDIQRRREEIMTLDVTGHYSRPDVFRFEIDNRRK